MDRNELIDMLNKDLADEHASIIRYLIHAYQVGEDTPLGSMLLNNAREEMWHMDWLGDYLGEMGVEPDMQQGIYPHDPTSNASLLRSYVAWEDNLVHVYEKQAEMVDDPELKRVLRQLGLESLPHKHRFERWLEILGPEGEEPLEFEEGSYSPEMMKRFHHEVRDQYKMVLQHLRHAFVFEDDNCPASSELELTAMRHMKSLSHFAETLAEYGEMPNFDYPGVDLSKSLTKAIQSNLAMTEDARKRFEEIAADPELKGHPGLGIELENMIMRNEYLHGVISDMLESVEAGEEIPACPEPPLAVEKKKSDGFTVGSLIKKD